MSDRRFSMVTVALSGFVTGGLALLVYLGLDLAHHSRLAKLPQLARPVAWKPKEVGSLVIGGGGSLPEEVHRRFLELAGGTKARIIVIPTANSFADKPESAARSLEVWKKLGVTDLRLMHTRSREEANSARFADPLAGATGVWFGGGTQSAVTDVYLDTEVERQLTALYRRGGVIGGSSAGAAVMTRLMIAGGRTDPVEARGFDFLPGSVVDQHFLKRNRVGRLLKLLTRHPELIGFGIDEKTALVVSGEQVSVIGDSYVMACLPAVGDLPAKQVILKRGDQAELSALKEQTATITSALDLDEILSANSH